jgi:hypothetical protein
MMSFPIRIELAHDMTVQGLHDADPGEGLKHAGPALPARARYAAKTQAEIRQILAGKVAVPFSTAACVCKGSLTISLPGEPRVLTDVNSDPINGEANG